MMNVETRGILTMIGFRKTTGSQEFPWPETKVIQTSFNRPNTILTVEERRRRLNPPSKLTVGARGLTKHAHRSSEGFWGENRGTEAQKNENARQKLNLIIKEAVWVNLHLLPH